jgi:hypothetical protein
MRRALFVLALLLPAAAAAQDGASGPLTALVSPIAQGPWARSAPGAPVVAGLLPTSGVPEDRIATAPALAPDALQRGRRLSVAGGIVGGVVGAAAGVALACLANRDSYGVYCGGQNDTKLLVGGVIGAGVGGWLGARLFARDR